MDSLRSAPRRLLLAIAVVAMAGLVVGACTSSATPAASASAVAPAPSVPAGPVTSAEDAVARVLATDPRFATIKPLDPNSVGGCCFTDVTSTAVGYAVTIQVGWGDCPAGCINRHHWFFGVTSAGTVTLDHEDGPPVPAGAPGSGFGDTGAGGPGISGFATAGPVCPVVRPNDPNCADRPVAGATLHILDATGTEVAQLETDSTGAFVVTLPPGRYRVQPDPVKGLIGTAPTVDVVVGGSLAPVQIVYDTGIR